MAQLPQRRRRLNGVLRVLRPRQHSIGYMGDGFYRPKDPTNSIKVLKGDIHYTNNRKKYTNAHNKHKAQVVKRSEAFSIRSAVLAQIQHKRTLPFVSHSSLMLTAGPEEKLKTAYAATHLALSANYLCVNEPFTITRSAL